mgnify:CR=1 FL=1
MKIELQHLSIQIAGKTLLEESDLTMGHTEEWAIVGASGSGKTLLAKAIAKNIFYSGNIVFLDDSDQPFEPRIILVDQQHRFKNKSNVDQFYYQQRYNSIDAEETITVQQDLDAHPNDSNIDWIDKFQIKSILNKPIIQLSNGENKRLQLVKALIQDPDLIVLDNPFIGLDIDGRAVLTEMLNEIVKDGKKIILITSPQTLPSCITKIASIVDRKLMVINNAAFIKQKETHSIQISQELLDQFNANNQLQFDDAVNMNNVSISYNEKIILKAISWKVKKGERWCLSGHNGSGKSTLVSLITADNPQAYANDIFIFDREKGSGESIWDIKKHIGFVSPELHLFFDRGFTSFDIIASGLFDTIGLFRKINPEQENKVTKWMEALKIIDLKNRYLNQLSLGQQRLVMLARALVKAPPLLILDEPCQGLDPDQTSFFRSLIDVICEKTSTTLIYISHFKEDIPKCIKHQLHLEKGEIKV